MPTPFPFVANSVLTAAQLNSISELPTRTLTGSGAAVAADSYSRVILNGTSITYTINTSTFSAGQLVELYNANSTAATIAAGAGVTLNGAAGFTLAQYQTAELYAVSATSFILWKSDANTGILQVQSAIKTDAFSSTSSTFVDITGVSVSITPRFSTSTIWVVVTMPVSHSSPTGDSVYRLLRGSTAIGVSTAGTTNGFGQASATYANSMFTTGIAFLDTPATTSATTYKVQGVAVGGGTFFVNRRAADTSFGGVTTITACEVAA